MFAGNDRFKLVRELGAGGMGVVYEALDEHRKTKVALKTLPHTNADLLYRLKREFRSLRDFVHPNLVRLDELFEDAGHWFFTMEMLEGENLHTHFRRVFQLPLGSHDLSTQTWLPVADTKRERPVQAGVVRAVEVSQAHHDPHRRRLHSVDFERITKIFLQVAEGLVALHEGGQVHRDIKPSNIMITPNERVVILDFGLVTIASDADSEISREGEVVGTAAYMAPEQAAARVVGTPADWYSLGVMLYEVITGRKPFDGNAVAIMTSKQAGPPRAVQALSPQCPPDLAELCMALLLTDPDQRPSGADVLQRLGPPEASPRTRVPTLQRSFVGRDAELGALRRAFDDVETLVTVAVFVHGESVIGKSTLIRQFLTTLEAQRSDIVVLSGQCREH
jgi:serine/threonine protein kinase